MKDRGKREGWSCPRSWELPDTLHWPVLSTPAIESKRKACTLSVSSNKHESQPRNWLRWSSQWSLDTWTIKCNCLFLEENITIREPQLPHMGNVSKRCPWLSQPMDGLVTELRGPWGGDSLSSSTSGSQKARLLAPFWVHQWEVPCVLYEGVRSSPFWKITP